MENAYQHFQSPINVFKLLVFCFTKTEQRTKSVPDSLSRFYLPVCVQGKETEENHLPRLSNLLTLSVLCKVKDCKALTFVFIGLCSHQVRSAFQYKDPKGQWRDLSIGLSNGSHHGYTVQNKPELPSQHHWALEYAAYSACVAVVTGADESLLCNNGRLTGESPVI